MDLDICQGETLAVVGASGVGKSTLLHILGTLERPSTGKVHWDGQDIFSLDDRSLAAFRNRKVGFRVSISPFAGRIQCPGKRHDAGSHRPSAPTGRPGQAEAILVRVGLKERLTHRVSTLSGGEQQRVAVARALVLEPEVLLADEPTGNLDPKSGGRVQELILELNHERGLTSVIVTHNLEMARVLDRQITLLEGKAVILQGE